MLGEAKVTGALVEFGLDEREATMEGMILIDLRIEVGSKKTAPDTVSFTPKITWVYHTGFILSVTVGHNVRNRRSLQITVNRNQIRVIPVQLFDNLHRYSD